MLLPASWAAPTTTTAAPQPIQTTTDNEQGRAQALQQDPLYSDQVQTLSLGTQPLVIAAHLTALPQAAGALILVPEFNSGPLTAGLTRQMYRTLPLQGWNVVAINNADLPLPNATEPDKQFWSQASKLLKPRLQETIGWLAQHGEQNLILVGQGTAGLALMQLTQDNTWPAAIQGIILLAPPPLPDRCNPLPGSLAHFSKPLLILQDFLPSTLQKGCDYCVQYSRQTQQPFRQLFLAGNDPSFRAVSPYLLRLLETWLSALKGTPVSAARGPGADVGPAH